MTIELTGSTLSISELTRVARDGERVELARDVAGRVRSGRAIVERLMPGDPIYGLNTGVGVRKRVRVPVEELPEFNRRSILEHRVGQGPPAPPDVVRAQLLLVTNSFARGTAGVRMELLEHLVGRLNDGALPEVRSLGSIGIADLPANADLAYGLLDGIELAAKEGLALLNHNAYSTARAALAFTDAERLVRTALVAAALDLEALAGNLSVLNVSGDDLHALLKGSYLEEPGAARNLQDPLSFRCIPQVAAAARDTFAFARATIERELNRSQENPLVLLDEGSIVSVGSFDALPLAQALDLTRIALAPLLTSAAERTVKLLQSPITGLPEGLAAEAGLAESGLSELGVPVQAFAAEAKLLAQPVSIETASTSHHEGIEDRITLAPLSARRLAEMVGLGARVVSVELVVAAQAIDLRGGPRLGAATTDLYAKVRELVPFTGRGDPPPQDLEPVVELVRRF
ncbi:MAG TPA: aromatic amino acid ammonia-lyase [Gaiellaceae bacterium]|nr:aromatic amino acid ammonia-lyase [Gaiellaceae bacterium]